MLAMPERHNPRMEWSSIPASVRQAVDERLGSAIVRAVNIAGGFSPGPAARCSLADGRSVFVKACGSGLNAFTPSMHRLEASILTRMPADYPVPRLIDFVDDGEWVALLIEHVEGTMPRAPLSLHEVTAVLQVVELLARLGSPTPIAGLAGFGPSARENSDVYSWARLVDDGLVDCLDQWSSRHFGRMVDLESNWLAAIDGNSLVHGDLRTDNIIIGASTTFVVDWPAASLGAPWVDLVGLLPALHLDGGPEPHEIFATQPLANTADGEAVNSYLAALAGYFTRQSLLPPPPGIAAVRGFQRAQGKICRDWLARRLGLD